MTLSSTGRRTTALLAISFAAVLLAGCRDEAPAAAPPSSTAPTSATSAAPSPTKAAIDTTDPGNLVRASQISAGRAANGHAVTWSRSSGGEITRLDVRGRTDGANQEATVNSSLAGICTTRTAGRGRFVKGDYTFWSKNHADRAREVAGKWAPETDEGARKPEVVTLRFVINSLETLYASTPMSSSTMSVTPVTYASQQALRVAARDPAANLSITVTATPDHLPLQVISPSVRVTYSEWNTVPAYAAPPVADQLPQGEAADLLSHLPK
ncbi:hypothetical protein [Luteipulveratus mongoliensis]|uniref:Lipoprotein n=1 Tax=Luteipulveratus mongoliensis TaxID=571913 RepID=A0A0K1JPA0_9MICO|nr:hypothetical protein [Luteipulveratus mongoliensis]AKU18400.1 hypothetical protein VV02_25385 [Luteipulveratus mongoliensis]